MSIFRDLGVKRGEHQPAEEMLYNLAACYQMAERRIEEVLAPFGLSPAKINALLIICHAGGGEGLSQSSIGKRLIVTAGNVTRLIDRLEKEGWVERVPGKDRRVKLIRATAKGAQLLDRAWPDYQKTLRGIGALVPQADIRKMNSAMDAFRIQLKGRLS